MPLVPINPTARVSARAELELRLDKVWITSWKTNIPLAKLALADTKSRGKQVAAKYVIQTFLKSSVTVAGPNKESISLFESKFRNLQIRKFIKF